MRTKKHKERISAPLTEGKTLRDQKPYIAVKQAPPPPPPRAK